jgi:hypothetical protein
MKGLIPVSKLVELFAVEPEKKEDDTIVYYPGGSSTLGELNKRAQEAGPNGLMMGGASRVKTQRKRRTVRRSNRKVRRKTRQNRKI